MYGRTSMKRPPTVSKKCGQRHISLRHVSLSYIGRCICIVFLVLLCIQVSSVVSAFYFDRTSRLNRHQRQHQSYLLPNGLSQSDAPSSRQPKVNTEKITSTTTALYTATINSLPQQQTSRAYMQSGDILYNTTSVNSLLSNNRTIAETTWHLLNGTEIGSWDRTDFEMMEYIVESLCGTSSSSSHALHQPQHRVQQQQQQYKRTALIIERFLHRIVQEQRMENPFADCVDMTALYTNLIYAWSNSFEMGSPERAEEILDYFQTIYEEDDSYDPLLCGPTIDSFNAVIGAYAQSGRSDAPQQSIRVLTKLYELNKAGRTMATPNQQSFARKCKMALSVIPMHRIDFLTFYQLTSSFNYCVFQMSYEHGQRWQLPNHPSWYDEH